MLWSGEVETVKVHDFVPRRYKVLQELLLGVSTCVDLRQGPKLGVRTEDQVDSGGAPLECARCAIATFEHPIVFRFCLPRRAHVEQIHKEVIGQRLRPFGKTPCWDFPKLAFKTRMPPMRTVISGAVSVSSWARSTNSSSGVTAYLAFR